MCRESTKLCTGIWKVLARQIEYRVGNQPKILATNLRTLPRFSFTRYHESTLPITRTSGCEITLMARPEVTITLGRSGQKVVKDSRNGFHGSPASASLPSGRKRPLAESLASSADNAFIDNKRMRNDVGARSYGYSSHLDGADSHLGPKDLRLKLTQKRMLREVELENEENKKKELHEKLSKAIRSVEPPGDKLLRSAPSSRMGAETSKMGSMVSPYASRPANGAGARSPERVPRSSIGISTPGSAIFELPQLSLMRATNVARTESPFRNIPLDSSRPNVPMPTAARCPLDAGKLVTEFPPAPSGMSIPPLQPSLVPKESQPLTVSSLLNSLGLGKYYINFQAEEIDMAVLKQMGEVDLKELGIPMGPRKKIYLALQAARTKHPVTQAQINYLQKS